MSAGGVTPCLVIDGQQRVTTVTLLLIALARYARRHSDKELPFSLEEIIDRGYLVNKYKKGDDRYKLMLSQGDCDTLRALEDNLMDSDAPLPDDSSRLTENLAFFEGRLEGLADVGLAWSGLHRLEVVSISLTQGQDNPQLIFESMNSTGKDLAAADLIRNFCLMSYPATEQEELYRAYWRPIEETLGAASYDEVFDEFVRCWLTVVMAPDRPAGRDVYRLFKRYVEDEGLSKPEEMRGLLLELKRFAGYYARVTRGAESDEELRRALGDVSALDISVADVLLVAFYDDCEAGAFKREDFVSMVRVLESYLFRRMVCDVPTNGLNKFFPSLLARLRKAKAAGEDYPETFSSMLAAEAGTARRFPDDREFTAALRTRNCYGFRRSLLLLSRLENSYHPKSPRDFSSGNYTIEHIMPQAALKSPEWLASLGENPEETFEEHVNTLGNLTLTAYNSELSDGSFARKRSRVMAGYDNDFITISQSLKEKDAWTPSDIEARGAELAERATEIWPAVVARPAGSEVSSTRRAVPKGKRLSWPELFAAELVPSGTVLYSSSKLVPGTAVVTQGGKIKLEDGSEYASPSSAFSAHSRLCGGSGAARNGWSCWRVGSLDGPLLSVIRGEAKAASGSGLALRRSELWSVFWESCDGDVAFSEVFGDVGDRNRENLDNWATLGVGYGFCQLIVRLMVRDGVIKAGVEFPRGERFDELEASRVRIEALLAEVADDLGVEWERSGQSRAFIWLHYGVDFGSDDLNEAWTWLRRALLVLRSAIRGIFK